MMLSKENNSKKNVLIISIILIIILFISIPLVVANMHIGEYNTEFYASSLNPKSHYKKNTIINIMNTIRDFSKDNTKITDKDDELKFINYVETQTNWKYKEEPQNKAIKYYKFVSTIDEKQTIIVSQYLDGSVLFYYDNKAYCSCSIV